MNRASYLLLVLVVGCNFGTDPDAAFPTALSNAPTISNPTKPHGSEHVQSDLVDWQINQNFASVYFQGLNPNGACFALSAWDTQAENTPSYDLLIVDDSDERSISKIPPTATNGQVTVKRRWTKPQFNEFHVKVDDLAYVDYTVCFPAPVVGPKPATIILRGTNTWKEHSFAVFSVSRMGA
jgi:hypothetical protein